MHREVHGGSETESGSTKRVQTARRRRDDSLVEKHEQQFAEDRAKRIAKRDKWLGDSRVRKSSRKRSFSKTDRGRSSKKNFLSKKFFRQLGASQDVTAPRRRADETNGSAETHEREEFLVKEILLNSSEA